MNTATFTRFGIGSIVATLVGIVMFVLGMRYGIDFLIGLSIVVSHVGVWTMVFLLWKTRPQ